MGSNIVDHVEVCSFYVTYKQAQQVQNAQITITHKLGKKAGKKEKQLYWEIVYSSSHHRVSDGLIDGPNQLSRNIPKVEGKMPKMVV